MAKKAITLCRSFKNSYSTARTRNMTRTSRRSLIKTGLATTVVATGAAGGWLVWRRGKVTKAFDQAVGPAFQPWDDWAAHRHEKSLMTVVRAGILAASAHNAQPWVFAIHEDREAIDIYADTTRNTGMLDPYLREMFMGIGCCIENMYQAARALGYRVIIETEPGQLTRHEDNPEKPLKPAARLIFSDRAAVPSVFYEAIPWRRTHRGPYIPAKKVPAELLRAMQRLCNSVSSCKLYFFSDKTYRDLFRDLVVKATQDLINSDQATEDSHRWVRLSQAAIDRNADGLTIDSLALSATKTALAKMAPPPDSKSINAHWLKQTRDIHLQTAPLFGMISQRNPYDMRETVQTGMLWQRLHLYGTANGLAMQPLNQPMEMVDIERAKKLKPETTGRILALLPETEHSHAPVFTFRMGYSFRAIPPSPRRGPDQTILVKEEKSEEDTVPAEASATP